MGAWAMREVTLSWHYSQRVVTIMLTCVLPRYLEPHPYSFYQLRGLTRSLMQISVIGRGNRPGNEVFTVYCQKTRRFRKTSSLHIDGRKSSVLPVLSPQLVCQYHRLLLLPTNFLLWQNLLRPICRLRLSQHWQIVCL